MADTLVSLKRTPAEKREERREMEAPYEGEDYDYGLRLHLDDDNLAKLGVDKADVGTDMMLMAKVRVVGYSEGASERHKHRSLELQITDAALSPSEEADRPQTSTVLYGRD